MINKGNTSIFLTGLVLVGGICSVHAELHYKGDTPPSNKQSQELRISTAQIPPRILTIYNRDKGAFFRRLEKCEGSGKTFYAITNGTGFGGSIYYYDETAKELAQWNYGDVLPNPPDPMRPSGTVCKTAKQEHGSLVPIR